VCSSDLDIAFKAKEESARELNSVDSEATMARCLTCTLVCGKTSRRQKCMPLAFTSAR